MTDGPVPGQPNYEVAPGHDDAAPNPVSATVRSLVDVTWPQQPANAQVTVKRDGEVVYSALAGETKWTDESPVPGQAHTYEVDVRTVLGGAAAST